MELTKILICFYFTFVEITYCSSQISDLKDQKIRIRDHLLGESSQLRDAESAAVTPQTFNPCFNEGSRTEENSEIFTGNPLLFPNDTSHRFSDHFLNCIRVDIEPGSYESLSNGSIYVPRLSRTFDKPDFCQSETAVAFVCADLFSSDDGNSTADESGVSAYAHLSDEFLNCHGGQTELEKESFEYRSNRTVYVPKYDRFFDYTNYFIGPNGTLYICPTFFHKEEKFSKAFEIVTILGLSVSIVFIVLYMVFFAFMESLRNLPGYCLFSLCLALLTAYLCFLLRSMGPNPEQCRDLVLSIMYFFLAAFFWMNVLSFDVWRSLKMATSKLRLSGNSMLWKRFALYSLYAWLSPLCIVIFGILVTKYQSSVKFLHLEFHPTLCWFAKKGALFVYLALPLVILMCLNVIFFTTSFVMISRASMNTSENMATFWKRFFLFLRLAVIMGVAWIFGIIAAATNQPVLFFIFVILNTLQGVFIFFSFALNEKTKKHLKNKIRLRKSSVFPSQVTSQPAQSVTTV